MLVLSSTVVPVLQNVYVVLITFLLVFNLFYQVKFVTILMKLVKNHQKERVRAAIAQSAIVISSLLQCLCFIIDGVVGVVLQFVVCDSKCLT